MVVKKTVFVSDDGKYFDTEHEALVHDDAVVLSAALAAMPQGLSKEMCDRIGAALAEAFVISPRAVPEAPL